MKINYLLLLLTVSLGLGSCIKDEALNAEADILTATIPEEIIKSKTVISNDQVTFFVNIEADITKLAPTFTLTEGATIIPVSGTMRDFSTPQQYTVTSQDGAWKKNYIVSAITTELSTKYYFENTEVKSNAFYEWYEIDDKENKFNLWSTANTGFNLSYLFSSGKPDKDNFITTIEPEGKSGKGVKMQTLKTGPMGVSTAPISAGNLFLGSFVTNISKPLESPRFGIDWNEEPIALAGYYKYTAGTDFEVHTENNATNLTKDTFDAYAIYFEKGDIENGDPVEYLKATHNFADPRIVSVARIKAEDRKETQEWTYFKIPFTRIPGKEIDPNKKYMLAVVFSSSLEGDKYNGAIGSTLCIDDVEIITPKN